MKRVISVYLVLAVLLLGLPMLGVWLAGREVATYLEFPPRTQYIQHAPFSWAVFIGLALVILVVLLPFLIRIGRACRAGVAVSSTPARPFPWWGWLSVSLGLVFWIVAWTRFPQLEGFQPHTFTPLWICYIIALNALTYRRTNHCLLTHETTFFFWLFPLSAAFWWFFEYLNRFVQNWYYTTGMELSAFQYFLTATLPFATVLPAVMSTEEWLASNPRNAAGLENGLPIRFRHSRSIAFLTLTVSAMGLLFISWIPDLLFPMLWIAPLLLLISFQCLQRRPSFFPEVRTGDWRRIYRLGLAALICGLLWELWNWHSLAKWIYTIPFVDRFHLFEMPVLGFAGYLPFGLECAVIADLIRKRERSQHENR